MVRRPMGTLVKPGLTFGWVVKWKSGLNFVGIPVNDVISTFTYTSNTRAPSLEATMTNLTRVDSPRIIIVLSLKSRTKRFRCKRFPKKFFTIIFRLSLNRCDSTFFTIFSTYVILFICKRKVLPAHRLLFQNLSEKNKARKLRMSNVLVDLAIWKTVWELFLRER